MLWKGGWSVSCEGNACACAYVCMSLREPGRCNRSERLCTAIYLREYDCVRLGVRNSEWVRPIV